MMPEKEDLDNSLRGKAFSFATIFIFIGVGFPIGISILSNYIQNIDANVSPTITYFCIPGGFLFLGAVALYIREFIRTKGENFP